MAEAPVTEQLAGSGAIRRPEGRHRGLGSYHRTTVTDPDQVLALQEAVRNAVRADPAAVPEDVLALVVLAVECEVTTVFSPRSSASTNRRSRPSPPASTSSSPACAGRCATRSW
ncbi:hypothetical protein SMICM17S_01628 [Streptomyces microflavus]